MNTSCRAAVRINVFIFFIAHAWMAHFARVNVMLMTSIINNCTINNLFPVTSYRIIINILQIMPIKKERL